ncbi:MAG: hypothetical protein A3B66_06935 [Alphaproteobacteria bacterium RIFCSPHIGHO2_02_FULL_46_13]|nr:MAG: hypothetical protein A3B66_06935 [Alphaproteobacteria bacterium RIFCSPHIGHO2_02_FULL_46_13]
MHNSQKPNILFLTHVGQPGGAEFVMLRLCNAVRDQCSVLHFMHGPLEGILKTHQISSSVLSMPDNLSGLRRSGGWRTLVKLIPAVMSMAGDLAKKQKSADIIVCMSQKSFILGALANLISRKQLIWFMNDLVSPEHFSKALIFVMTKVFARFADKIVVNSKASYDAWILNGGDADKTVIVYPGSDVADIEQQINNTSRVAAYRQQFGGDNAPVIGMFGRISHWKGQDVFIKALSRLQNVRGVIVGEAYFDEDKYFQELKDLMAQNNLNDKITFTGHLHDVPTAMAACDVVVHASTHAEPFGLVIVEAILSNKPVIASNAGGAQEIIINEETGFLTPIGDDAALAKAIQTYLDDPEHAKIMAEKSKTRALEKFSNDTMVTDFKSLLKNIV